MVTQCVNFGSMKQLSKHTRTRLIWRGGKKVRAHRWIMEQHIGRPLKATEDVHHLNGNPLDNRIENLVVMTRLAHSRLHAIEKQKYPDIKKCAKCGSKFKVNPRKRARNKCCSTKCASQMRADGRRKQAGGFRDFQSNQRPE